MGQRGPVPKRSSERRRRNKDSTPQTLTVAGRAAAADPAALAQAHTKAELVAMAESVGAQFAKSANKAMIAEAIVEAADHPPADPSWHEIARDWYESLAQSGQSTFYEPSDWQGARYVAQMMSKHLRSSKPSAFFFTAIWSAMTDLLTTEASRRRVRLEIERSQDGGEDDGKVTAIDAYRNRVTASG